MKFFLRLISKLMMYSLNYGLSKDKIVNSNVDLKNELFTIKEKFVKMRKELYDIDGCDKFIKNMKIIKEEFIEFTKNYDAIKNKK